MSIVFLSLSLASIPSALRVGCRLIGLALPLALLACGGEIAADETASGPDAVAKVITAPEPVDMEPSPEAPDFDSPKIDPMKRYGVAPHLGDLDALVERRVIRILTVYGPGRYFLDNGPQGAVQEYAQKLQQVVNKTFNTGLLLVQVAVIPVARDQLFPALEAGFGDIVMAGTTMTEARAKRVDFTIPVSKPLREILVTGPSAPNITALEDLAGKTVYVRKSSSYAESIRQLSARLVAQGKPAIRIDPVDESLEDEDLIEMVNAGLLPWAVVDDYKPAMWRDVFTDVRIREDLVLREGGRLAWAIRPESPKLKTFLDNFLRDNREGTLFGNILRNRYIRDFDWAENAVGVEEIGRYRRLANLFRQYGDNYGIDPTLLAAQGFQESRLDQSVRSHAGAIGVMQLLPSTAQDKNVDIPNIEELEPNIEAGAKYMAFLRSRYFSSPELTELNGSLLALAAYNAGPGKIRRLRNVTAERGYDPNVWFDNVEVIVAEQVGRETVQYVANIFKYYLTYRWINAADAERAAARRASGIDSD